MSNLIRQAVCRVPGQLELRELPMFEPAPGELVVRVDLALTCGTDLKTWRRGRHPKFPLPTPLGHEYTGTVERVGRGVTRFRAGDPVLAVPSAPCGSCPTCQRGLGNLCPTLSGETMAWGAFADCIRIPSHVVKTNVFHRPANLDLRHGALLEPLSCVVNGVSRLDLIPVHTALVMGAGPIGLLFVALLRRRGVPRVILMGKRTERLAAGEVLGAHEIVDIDAVGGLAAAEQQVRDLTDGGPCAVVECVGRTESWEQAIRLVRVGGEVLLYGGCPGGSTIALDTTRLHYEGLTLKGAFHFTPSDVRISLDLILQRALPLDVLVSDQIDLADLQQGLERLSGGDGIKLAVIP